MFLPGWVIEYPEFAKLADEQMHTFWPWNEPAVENDIQDVRVRMTTSEYNAFIDNQFLFTLYELAAGTDYWAGRIMKKFKRPEIQRMASMFSAVELNSHAPFYNRINELLGLNDEEFFSRWKKYEPLVKRMEFLESVLRNPNDLYSIAAFTFVEGAVLYSSFAFLKHFQAQECGKDLIKNICGGISLSVADEHAHSIGGAMLFRILHKESNLSLEESAQLKDEIYKVAATVYEHECAIIDLLHSHGPIVGLTSGNLKSFVKSRINLCLNNLGYESLFPPSEIDGFIDSWFYTNTTSVQLHDFFTGGGSEYHINWKKEKFGEVWGQ